MKYSTYYQSGLTVGSPVRGLRTVDPNRQPHAKDCPCRACIATARAIKRAIDPAVWIDRQKPVEQSMFYRKSLPEHVVRRRLRGMTLSRYFQG